MSNNVINKVYSNIKKIFYHPETSVHKPPGIQKPKPVKNKTCPITGLDISMQPKNSKFLSYTGVRWYFDNDYQTYKNILEPVLKKSLKNECRIK